MKEINRLTDEIMKMSDLGIITSAPGFREYKLEHGTLMGWSLLKNDKIECIRAYMSEGTVFPLHEHEFSAETMILYSGAVKVSCEGENCETELHSMEIGIPFHVEAGKCHKLYADEESRMIAIFIPPDKELDQQ